MEKRRQLLCKVQLVLLVVSVVSSHARSVTHANSDSTNVVNIYFGDSHDHEDETGDADLAALKSEILDVLSASSCSELRDNHNISTSGYYFMRNSHFPSSGSYIYCDFTSFEGVSTCAELFSTYNISIYGYYLLGNDPLGGFHYCPDAYTCQHLVERDHIAESGFYTVGPPGNQFTVYCNLFSRMAVTEIWHDLMEEKKAGSCQSAGCYSANPQYLIAMDKIVKVIDHSNRCQQFIKYRCSASVLLYYPNSPYGYWKSRDGEKMTYWGGGSSKRVGYCACGETGTCVNKQKRCNCDINGGPETSDEGYLTDKTKLPVSQMRFGDTDSTGEHGWHTLGKLECMG